MSDTRIAGVFAVSLLLLTGVAHGNDTALEDPTRPGYLRKLVTQSAPSAPAWRVESVIVSSGRRLAVINGQVVGVNDRVGGARVIEILPYEVTIEYRDALRRIPLVPVRVKRPADRVVDK